MKQVLSSINLSKDSLTAIVLVALQSVFLIVNFTVGFNLFLYIVTAVITLVLSFIKPRAGLYALVVLTLIFAKFFTLQSLWLGDIEYKLYLVDIFLVGIILSLVLRLLAGKIKWKIKSVDLWLISFFVLTIIYFLLSITSWNGDFNTAFSSLKNYFFYPLLFFITLFLIDSKEHLCRLFKFIILGSVVILGFIVYGLIAGQGLWTEITPLSTVGSRILDFDHAFYLCLIGLSGLTYLIIKPDRWAKWWYLLLFIFSVGIVGSLMRHLWIALIVAFVFLFIAVGAQRAIFKKVVRKYIAIIVMVSAVAVMLAVALPSTRFSQELSDVQTEITGRAVSVVDSSDTSIAWRRVVWQGVWKEYQDNFVLGLGYGQRIFIDMGDYRDYVEVRNIHNSWLAIFVQMGLIGFAVLAIFLLSMLRKVMLVSSRSKEILIAKVSIASIIVFCSVAFMFQPYLEANFFNIMFWINLGLGRRLYEGITS